jgi:hypothetical protein
VTRTEDTETRGYCSWSEERSMLATVAVNEGNVGGRRTALVVGAPRLTNHNHVPSSYFIRLYSTSTLILYSYPENEQVNTGQSDRQVNRKDKLGTTSDSPLTHHAHLAHWRIFHKV